MTAFITWYILLTLLGWLTFPLAYFLFPNLTERGYTLARTAGLLIWGYAFWLLASLGIAQNDLGGILFALAILISFSAYILITNYQSLITFIKTNKSLIITTEILFLISFAFIAFARSANAELYSTEKPMELMFINSIIRSENFPPQDVWLSGYAISYYYFGYVMTAMLAKLSNINGSTAHNLMLSLVFALGAVGSYGILYNLLTNYASRTTKSVTPNSHLVTSSLLAPLFLLLVSNFEALLESLHKLGIFWTKDSNGTFISNFWTRLDMKELSQPPTEPFSIMPDRYLWWWRASRVIQDYDITGGFREVIDEFPFFSFLLGDLHPHVLAIPFGLLAISLAYNIFQNNSNEKIELFGVQLHLSPITFLFSAMVLGGLAFLNTWDILIGAALIVGAYVFSRVDKSGWNWHRLEDVFILGLPLGLFSFLLYLPFYFGFSSQAGGLLPNFMYVTRGTHLWVMWGTLFIPIFSYLLYLWRAEKIQSNWKLGFSLGIGFTVFLFVLTFLIGWAGTIVEKEFIDYQLSAFNMTIPQFISATSLRRLNHIGSLITLLAILIPTLSFLFPLSSQKSDNSKLITNNSSLSTFHFPLLLLTLGTILILAPEFVYLRDQFGYRINTVFKFYYQAWILLSLVASFGIAVLFQNLNKFANITFRIIISLVIFCGLLYPTFGLITKTNNFQPPFGFSLNDFERFARENPEDAAAVEFLLKAPNGVIAEAVGDGYSAYGRISMLTGLQTVLGWPGHEAQWRGSYDPQGSRRDDIQRLYTTSSWDEAQLIIKQYNIRYIYIGLLERVTYPINEEKFYLHLSPVFQQGNTVIFETSEQFSFDTITP
ncbi:MAG: hypothetical protein UZ14_CFX002000503 [Chloroflexi bacterium OLB14]|nr:MAG: hypothetical protein UZ14_CFX002000503 [Chloroflexi bacterium OLB14]